MAFSFKNIISSIPYFNKHDERDSGETINGNSKKRRHTTLTYTGGTSKGNSSKKLNVTTISHSPINTNNQFVSKYLSLSDSDLRNIDSLSIPNNKGNFKKSKKLQLDCTNAKRTAACEALNLEGTCIYQNRNVENTPERINLQAQSSEIFSERLKEFDLSKSIDLFDIMNEDNLSDKNYDVESLSEQSDSDLSLTSHGDEVKMCRKIQLNESRYTEEGRLVQASSSESFADVELDKNEEERISLLLSYQTKFEKMETLLKKLLSEFQFHIEVSKLFHTKTVVVTPHCATDMLKMGNSIICEENSTDSWNIIIEKEDTITKIKLRKQLLAMNHFISEFINIFLPDNQETTRKAISASVNDKPPAKRLRINKKKCNKRINDFPDLKEAMENLFSLEAQSVDDDVTVLLDEFTDEKCCCNCRYHRESSPSQTDSGLKTKSIDDKSNQSITSSLGNFTLDSSTLSAYSESLDNILSYNSFHDTSLYNTMLQKAAIDRITFYIQVHGIQLKSEANEIDFETKNIVIFNCHSCGINEENEQELLKHILSQKHCEKIHFLYKTKYIKKCFETEQEIQPSTVLNPMQMYRDGNKIVCFGDGQYACSLCLENMILGESVLIAHCGSTEHIARKQRLLDIFE